MPQNVHEAADARVLIPMRPGLRSINVAMAAALVAGEALRQTGGFTPEAFSAFEPGFEDAAARD